MTDLERLRERATSLLRTYDIAMASQTEGSGKLAVIGNYGEVALNVVRAFAALSAPASGEAERLPGPDYQLDRVFIGAGEYVRWDQAVATVMRLQKELYAMDAKLTSPVPQPDASRFFWVIERTDADTWSGPKGAPLYVGEWSSKQWHGNTRDIGHALKFASREDAEAFVRDHLNSDPAFKVAEHGWLAAPQADVESMREATIKVGSAALALPAEKAEPVAENDKAREIAKLLALAGLAVDRHRGSIPNDSWKPHEWCERILECIPQREVEHCLATAHQIARNFCSAAPLPASPASDAMREAVAWRCASEGDVQVEIVTDPHAARAYQAAGGWKVTPLYASPPAPEAEKLREALRLMLAHSCVADAGPDMKSEEDDAAERAARAALKENASG